MRRWFFILFGLWLTGSHAQPADSLWNRANRLYRQQKYAEALDTYRQLEKNDSVSAELYYNMGNAAYKMNKKALSIYYYKKALQLKPHYAKARHNLDLIRRSLVDRIEPAPVPFYRKLWLRWTGLWDVYVWGVLSLVLIWLAFAWALAYLLTAKPALKRLFFVLSWLTLAAWALAFVSFRSAARRAQQVEAVVAVEETAVYPRPGFDAAPEGKLHEGTTVRILQQQGEWFKARTADGHTFWLPGNTVMLLRPWPNNPPTAETPAPADSAP